MTQKKIAARLSGGDRRSLGQASPIAALVSNNPSLFPALFSGLSSEDRLVRMRAADAAEKVTRSHRDLLLPHKKELLRLLAESEELELRWHLAVMIPRVPLTLNEERFVSYWLRNYLKSSSSIVKTFALQGLADLARNNPRAQARLIPILRQAARKGTPAMKARARRLLNEVEMRKTKRSRKRR